MATRSEKKRAGLFLGGGVVLFLGVLVFIGYVQLQQEGVHYYTHFNKVRDLSEGAPVKCNGVHIGEVKSITFSEGLPYKIKVGLLIEKERRSLIMENTKAQLSFLSPLSGRQCVSLNTDGAEAEREPLPAGSEIPSESSQVQETFETIKDNLEQMNVLLRKNRKQISDLLDNSNRILNDVHTLFTGAEKPSEAPEGSLVHIAYATDQALKKLQDTAGEIQGGVKDIRALVKSEKVQKDIRKVSQTLNHIEKVSRRSAKLSRTLQELSTNFGGALEENRPAFRKTVKSLQQTSKNLENLSSKLRRTPSALIRTKPPAKRNVTD